MLRMRIAEGSIVHADEAGGWDGLHANFEMRRINHSVAYSLNGACTNQAESYFSRLRRAEVVFQRLANRILKSLDLQEVLLLITHEAKSRLSADICGVICASVMTRASMMLWSCTAVSAISPPRPPSCACARDRAGRVLETRQVCSVEDYVRSKIISRDFFDLARAERVRSALGAPLLSNNTIVGPGGHPRSRTPFIAARATRQPRLRWPVPAADSAAA